MTTWNITKSIIQYENLEENPHASIEKAIEGYFALMEDRYFSIFLAEKEKKTDKIIYNLCNYLITKYYLDD